MEPSLFKGCSCYYRDVHMSLLLPPLLLVDSIVFKCVCVCVCVWTTLSWPNAKVAL